MCLFGVHYINRSCFMDLLWCSLVNFFIIVLSGGGSCRSEGQGQGASGAGQYGGVAVCKNNAHQKDTSLFTLYSHNTILI